ncbi:MAG: FliM/FliN family flagellar motor switch protein [Hyphomicrobiales bacterium]|nr:FliM/FliN family flagellar motor switch protein [Hyphomicrobiales bacterium]
MKSIRTVPVRLSVVLGRASMPVNHLLKMGRGAVIELDTVVSDTVEILANNMPIAKGDVVVQGDKIAVSITSKLSREEAGA